MTRKLISVLLSAVFVLSCFSTAFVAFAEDVALTDPPATLLENTATPAESDTASETENTEPEKPLDNTLDALLENYNALSEKESGMTSAQKSKLREAGDMLFNFGKDVTGALTSDEALAQYSQILALMSGTATTVLASVTKTGPVEAFEAKVKAYEGRVGISSPSEEDLKGYNEILKAYAGLTDEEKGQVDLFLFDKMLHLILDRERQVSIGKNTDVPSYDKQHNINAQIAAEALLGNAGYAAHFSKAKELYSILNDSSKTTDQKLEAYKNANQYARAYADCWSPTYLSFYNKLDSSSFAKGFMTLAKEYGKQYLSENPFTETAPTVLERPSAKDYPKGESDPGYVEAWSKYMAGSKAKAEYDCRKVIHNGACNIQGVKKVEAAAPEFAGLADFMSAAVAALQAFSKDSSQLAPAKAVSKTFDNMSAFLQAVILKNTTMQIYCEPTQYETYWSTSTKNLKEVYQQCADIGQYDKISAFEAVIKGIEEPYDNTDIIKAKESYDNVPLGLRIFIPSEIKNKYKAILACIGPDLPSFETPDLSIFKKTTVTYPTGVSRAQVAKALPRMETFLTGTVLPMLGVKNGLPSEINNKLYTNATVADICKFLYPTLANVSSWISAKPSGLASKLTEEKFKGAVTALKAAGSDWNALTLSNGDMGFQDGDKEGFLNAVAALFRPLSIITLALKIENTIDPSKGTYTYGAYEDLVPLFEALDLKGYLSSHEYTLYVNEVKEKNSDMVMDARVRPILVPIFNLIDQFAQNPLDTLVTVLPKLGFALKTDLLSKQIAALLGKISLISVSPPDLSAGALFDMLAPKLQNLDLNGTSISITLNKDNFLKFVDEIGGCGNAVQKNSKIRGKAYSLGVDPDKSDAFLVLFRWLYGELTSAQNSKAIQTAVDASTLSSMQKPVVKGALSTVSKISPDTALLALINVAAPPIPDFSGALPGIHLPGIGSVRPRAGGILPSIGDGLSKVFGGLFSGGKKNTTAKTNTNAANSGKTQTGNPNVPKTGGGAAVSLFVLAATAGIAAGAVLLKKKTDSDQD